MCGANVFATYNYVSGVTCMAAVNTANVVMCCNMTMYAHYIPIMTMTVIYQ